MAATFGFSMAGAQAESKDPTREMEANKAKSRIFKVQALSKTHRIVVIDARYISAQPWLAILVPAHFQRFHKDFGTSLASQIARPMPPHEFEGNLALPPRNRRNSDMKGIFK
jgi:hypothetical protein